MDIVDPKIDPALVPPGSAPHIFNGPNGDEYRDLPSVRTPHGAVITRWQPTNEERRRIANGEDLYLTIYSYGDINPVLLTVGVVDWR